MKKLTLLAFILSFGSLVSAQTLLWGGPNDPNSTFANGLGAWTTVGLSSSLPDSAKNAVWTYTASGRSQGGYSDLAGRINSPSFGNGAAIFDSDFLDNAGIEGNEGNGSAPSPHSGALVSPYIDCSGFTSVAVSFYQYYQNFASACFIEVSSDSGATWTPVRVNESVLQGNGTTRNNQQVIDITSLAAGKQGVRFRFVFDGDYYFWIIDDVTLVSLPNLDLAIRQPYYSPFSYAQPKSQICQDTFRFGASISNLGGQVQRDAKFKAEVLGSDRTSLIFADSVTVSNIDINDDNLIVSTPKFFVPSGLDIGKYFIRWSISGGQGTEYNPRDNSRLDSFEITTNIYAREPRARGGIRANGGTLYSIGTQYRTSDCWNANDKFFARSTDFSLVYGSLAKIDNRLIKFYMVEVKDDVLPDFSNFDKTNGINSPSVNIISEEFFTAKNEPAYSLINLPLTDRTTGDAVQLKPGTRYILMAEHPLENSEDPETWIYHASSLEKNYAGHPFANPVIDNAGTWFESWPEGESPVLRLNIEVITKTDEVALDEQVLNIFPNPVVSDKLQYQIQFEQPTDANITVFDENGRVLHFAPFKKIGQHAGVLNVNGYSAGNYFLRVSTEAGTRTKAFSVVK